MFGKVAPALGKSHRFPMKKPIISHLWIEISKLILIILDLDQDK